MSPPAAPAAIAILAVACVAPGALQGADEAGAAAPIALPDPSDPRWEPLRFPSIERTTRYQPLPSGRGIEARADCSASGRVLPLEGVDLAQTPMLHWRWRVDRPLDVPDERSRGGDDFAARVYVMFRFEPERASWLERARRGIVAALYDRELPGTALAFVWTSRIAPGTSWENPYASETRMIALERGADGGWREERVDLLRAHRDAFGHDPAEAVALGLMTDSDDSCGQAVARYAEFALHPRPAEAGRGDGPVESTLATRGRADAAHDAGRDGAARATRAGPPASKPGTSAAGAAALAGVDG